MNRRLQNLNQQQCWLMIMHGPTRNVVSATSRILSSHIGQVTMVVNHKQIPLMMKRGNLQMLPMIKLTMAKLNKDSRKDQCVITARNLDT